MHDADQKFDELLADTTTTIALVGATDNPGKYGHTIYHDLKSKGYTVWAVNPTRPTVDEIATYATLADLPERPDIVNVVVPSHIGIDIARQAKDLDYRNIWFQPGAENTEIVDYLESHNFTFLAGPCIMVRSR